MLVLASQSPRRREILADAGFEFKIMPADVDENVSCSSPEETVRALALKKAEAVAGICGADDTVLAADTLVFLGDEVLGKPVDEADAFRMLSALSGSTHRVITGVALIKGDKTLVDSVETRVIFKKLSEDDIKRYIRDCDPLDKAGAYGIQETGDEFVDHIEGDYNNVVGLPLARVIEMLEEI